MTRLQKQFKFHNFLNSLTRDKTMVTHFLFIHVKMSGIKVIFEFIIQDNSFQNHRFYQCSIKE